MTQTQDRWSEQVWRAPRWIRKKNQSMTPKLQPSHRSWKWLGLRQMLEHAEGVVDAEVAAAHHWHDDTNAAVAVKRSGRFVAEAVVAEAESAHHSNDDANAAAIEFDGRLVAEAAAALHHRTLESVNYELGLARWQPGYVSSRPTFSWVSSIFGSAQEL